MTHEPSRRPPALKPPAHLSPNPPVPEPSADAPVPEKGLSPVRYGDWEKNGIAVDF
jgi:hypothetical protein